MRNIRSYVLALIWLLLAGNVYAVSTATVYSSGVLVTMFLGLCGLIVVFQLLPAMVMLYAGVKAMFGKKIKVKS